MLSTCSANRALAIRAQEAGDDITGAKAGDDITGVGVSIKGSSMKDKVRNQREMISCKHGDFTLDVRFKQNRPRCRQIGRIFARQSGQYPPIQRKGKV